MERTISLNIRRAACASARTRAALTLVLLACATLVLLACATGVVDTQTPAGAPPPPAAGSQQAPASQQHSPTELEELVGPIALYPDDLLAIVLPSSTYPLDIVKAQRFLESRKSNPNLQPDANLPEPVRNLLNYPDVVKKMSDELGWTQRLGEAVVSQQADVVAAIQAFRRRAHAAGNLKTDDKQIVVVEKEVIKVVQADPQVIYVPQYQPSMVVVQSAAPIAYYPTPYPVYYYPYPPGATFATGFFFGAATAWAFSWGHHGIYHGYDIEELQEERIDYAREAREDRQAHANQAREDRQANRQEMQSKAEQSRTERQSERDQRQGQRQEGRPDRPQRPTEGPARGQASGQPWRSDKQAGQVSSGQLQARAAARPGDAPSLDGGQFGGERGGGARSSSLANSRSADLSSHGGGRFDGGVSGGRAERSSMGSSGGFDRGGDAFSGINRGGDVQRASSRGFESRSSQFGGGARAGGGGYGGARAGGGGRGGGRR